MKKILLLASVVFATTGYAQKLSNKLTFPKGQKLEIITETTKNASMEMMGNAMETKSSSTLTEIYEIKEASAMGATIEHKVKRMTYNASAMGRDDSFDSEKETDRSGEAGKLFEKSLKNKYTMVVDANGKVVTVKADDDNPNGTKTETDQIAEFVAQQLGLNLGLPQTGDPTYFSFLPAKEAGQGEKWVDSSSVNGVKKTTTYTVSSISDNEVTLDYVQDLLVNTVTQMMGQEAKINSRAGITGKIILDRKTGLLKQKTASIDSKGTIEAQGMSIPSSEKSTVTITVKPS